MLFRSDMLEFTVPVEQANSLLGADYAAYIHEDTNAMMVRTLSYALPAALQEHVSFVYPTTQYVDRSPAVIIQRRTDTLLVGLWLRLQSHPCKRSGAPGKDPRLPVLSGFCPNARSTLAATCRSRQPVFKRFTTFPPLLPLKQTTPSSSLLLTTNSQILLIRRCGLLFLASPFCFTC